MSKRKTILASALAVAAAASVTMADFSSKNPHEIQQFSKSHSITTESLAGNLDNLQQEDTNRSKSIHFIAELPYYINIEGIGKIDQEKLTKAGQISLKEIEELNSSVPGASIMTTAETLGHMAKSVSNNYRELNGSSPEKISRSAYRLADDMVFDMNNPSATPVMSENQRTGSPVENPFANANPDKNKDNSSFDEPGMH